MCDSVTEMRLMSVTHQVLAVTVWQAGPDLQRTYIWAYMPCVPAFSCSSLLPRHAHPLSASHNFRTLGTIVWGKLARVYAHTRIPKGSACMQRPSLRLCEMANMSQSVRLKITTFCPASLKTKGGALLFEKASANCCICISGDSAGVSLPDSLCAVLSTPAAARVLPFLLKRA